MAGHFTNDYEIRWRNYKAFKDTGWIKIRPLTILIGPNNSGKTSVFSPILLMSQTMASRDALTSLVTRGPLLDAGIFQDIIHRPIASKSVYFGFRYHTHDRKGKITAVGTYPPGVVEVTFKAGRLPEDVVVQKFELSDVFKRPYLRRIRNAQGTYTLEGMPNNRMNMRERVAVETSGPMNFLFAPGNALHAYRQVSGDRETLKRSKHSRGFQEYVGTVGYAFEELRRVLLDLSYIGPLRERPRRYYEVASEIPIYVGSQGEHTANVIRRHISKFEKRLNYWIKRFEFGHRLKVRDSSKELFALTFEDDKGRETNIADAGFGASQVLPLIVQAIAADEGTLTIAEQPEIHLNPRLQCELADLFVEMANSDHRVIVETHSEHLLLRLRRLIASGKIAREKVAIYFVEKDKGVSTIQSIELEDNGHISEEKWPSGFFEEILQESLALAEEQSRRSRKKGGKHA